MPRAMPSPVALLAAAAVVFLTPAAAQAQQDWPVRCNFRTSQIRFDAHGFLINFVGASAAARTRAPAEGECAWEDRGWRSEEPTMLSYRTEGEYATLLGADGQLMALVPLNSNPPEAERRAMVQVVQAWRSAGTITFFVVNEGRTMRVTRIAN